MCLIPSSTISSLYRLVKIEKRMDWPETWKARSKRRNKRSPRRQTIQTNWIRRLVSLSDAEWSCGRTTAAAAAGYLVVSLLCPEHSLIDRWAPVCLKPLPCRRLARWFWDSKSPPLPKIIIIIIIIIILSSSSQQVQNIFDIIASVCPWDSTPRRLTWQIDNDDIVEK